LRTFFLTRDIDENIDTGIWSTVEPGIALTAVSLACLRPLLAQFNLNWSLSTIGRSTYDHRSEAHPGTKDNSPRLLRISRKSQDLELGSRRENMRAARSSLVSFSDSTTGVVLSRDMGVWGRPSGSSDGAVSNHTGITKSDETGIASSV